MSASIADTTTFPAGGAPKWTSVVRTLAWRTVRRGWWYMLLVLLILCGTPTFLYASIRLLDEFTAAYLLGGSHRLKYLYFLITILTLPTLVLFEIMRVRELFPLPVTTRRIVNVQLVIGAVSVTGLYLGTVAYYRLVFGALVPVVGPLLFLVPGLVIAAGIVSLLIDARWWKPLLAAMAFWLCVYWISRRFDERILETAGAKWFFPSVTEMLLLIGLSVVGYGVVLHTARLDRLGEAQSWAVWEERLYRLVGWVMRRLPSRLPSLHISVPTTPASAQFSFEWLTKGLVLPVMAAFIGVVSLINAYFEPAEWLQTYTSSIPGILIFAMAGNGYFVGLMDGPGLQGQMDRFRATRPLSDWQLAVATFKNGLASTFAALAIAVVLACIVYVYARFGGHSHDQLGSSLLQGSTVMFRPGLLNYLGGLVAMLLLGWAAMGINISCISTGRHWIVMTLWIGGIGLMVLNIILEKHLRPEQYRQLVSAAVFGLTLLAVIGTLDCYQQAASRGLIPRRVVFAGVGLGLLAAGLCYAVISNAMPKLGLSRETAIIPMLGLGALAALPLASVPLAIAWNRHR